MYCHINIHYQNKNRTLTLPRLYNSQSIHLVLKKLFHLKYSDSIIGITDPNGKFYDVTFFTSNLHIFNKKTVDLITSSALERQKENELKFDPEIQRFNKFNHPISFATNSPHEIDEIPFNLSQNSNDSGENDTKNKRFRQQMIAEIYDLKIFQQLLLQDSITLILEAESKPEKMLNFSYYYLRGLNSKIYIYKNKKKICQAVYLPLRLNETQNIVHKILDSLNICSKQSTKNVQCIKKNQQKPLCKYFNNYLPENQCNKAYRRRQKIQNQFTAKQQSLLQIEASSQQYDIPIIIRKNNNKIQKVTASYPLSPQQTQAINTLIQLQLQSLLQDKNLNQIKLLILGQNKRILSVFDEYYYKKLDVKQLCKILTKIAISQFQQKY